MLFAIVVFSSCMEQTSNVFKVKMLIILMNVVLVDSEILNTHSNEEI